MDETQETVEVEVWEPPAQPPATLFRTDDPVQLLERATETANALAGVIRAQKLSTKISGRDHVRVEGWTLLGSMLGVFPVTVWTRPLADGQGWEARVEARTRDGAVVGAAESECTRDEKTWKGRDSYALRSMAQTRATSKALRHPLGFVMTLAGFDATPAEEMPRETATAPDERGEDPRAGRVKVPRGWAELRERMAEVGVLEPDQVEWLRQACDALGITSLADADPEVRKGVFKRACDVYVALSAVGRDLAFDPDARKVLREVYAGAFDGAVVDGPAWRISPAEQDRPVWQASVGDIVDEGIEWPAGQQV